MKRLLENFAVVIILACLFHMGFVLAVPSVVLRAAVKKIEETTRKRAARLGIDPSTVRTVNRLLPGPRRTAQTREVVAPNPDMLFSVVLYDVSERPLYIEAPVPDSYLSISCYADNTDNFFVINDRSVETPVIKLILVGEGLDVPNVPGARVVRAVSDTGVILFRYLIKNEEHYKEIERVRRKVKVRTLQR